MTTKAVLALIFATLALTAPLTAQERDLEKIQKEFLKLKFGMFLHFNMSTFVPGGWATGREDPLKFNPEALDIGQWADAAQSAHMKYAVLTVKHTGGWCLWPSDTTEHDVALFKNYRNGKGDIVREFVDAFRSRGLKVGFYYCFPLWGKGWQNYMTLPHKDYATGNIDALGLIKAQFKELLTRYGKIDLVWIDQSGSPHGGLKPGDWLKVKNYLHELQPDCMVIANNATDLTRSDVYGYEYPYSLKLPQPGNTIPSEVCDKLNAGWFANPNGHAVPVRSADYVVNKMLLPLIHRNSNYLLNCSPERTGKLHPETVARLKEIGAMWNPEHPDQYDKELYGIQTSAVTHIPNPEQRIALCIGRDFDGKTRDRVVEILSKHGVKATFFIGGDTAEQETAELRELVKAGHSLGNGTRADKPIADETAMKIRDYVARIQSKLTWIETPVAVCFPEGVKQTWNLWTTLNYFQLLLVESRFTIDSDTNAGKLAEKLASGDIVMVRNTPGVAAKLEAFLKGAEAGGFKIDSLRNTLRVSTSRRFRTMVAVTGAKVETGRE
jgi:alpha-L-fucosidase